MTNSNFGIAKAIISNSMVNEFINEGVINESKIQAKKFFNIVKTTPTLLNEFNVINSIENKFISDESKAIRYIDKCVSLFENFSTIEIVEGYNKINDFVNESNITSLSEEKVKLYTSISNLIIESSKNENVNVDLLHESFENILSYLKEKKSNTSTSQIIEENLDLDYVIEIATNKFNETYESLDENQKNILNKLVYGNSEVKQNIFENLKSESLQILKNLEGNGYEDRINEGISALNNMKYSDDNSIEKIIDLYEFKIQISQ